MDHHCCVRLVWNVCAATVVERTPCEVAEPRGQRIAHGRTERNRIVKSLKAIRQLVRDTLHRFVRPIGNFFLHPIWCYSPTEIARIVKRDWDCPVSIDDYARMRDALEVARSLILQHHNCSVRVEPGQMCPHCCEADGSSPKLDKIWDALARPNPELTLDAPSSSVRSEEAP